MELKSTESLFFSPGILCGLLTGPTCLPFWGVYGHPKILYASLTRTGKSTQMGGFPSPGQARVVVNGRNTYSDLPAIPSIHLHWDLPTMSQVREEAALYFHHVRKTPLPDSFPNTPVLLDPLVTTNDVQPGSSVSTNMAQKSSTVPALPATSSCIQFTQSGASAAGSTGQPVNPRYFPEEHADEWGAVTPRVSSKDRSSKPATNVRTSPVIKQPPLIQAVIPCDVPLPVAFPSNVAQPASRANQSPLPINRPVASADCAASSFSAQPFPSVSLQDRSVAPINDSDSVPPV